jgi:hypothetical protein
VLGRLALDQLAQRSLGFATGQSFFAAAAPYRTDPAIGATGSVVPAP